MELLRELLGVSILLLVLGVLVFVFKGDPDIQDLVIYSLEEQTCYGQEKPK